MDEHTFGLVSKRRIRHPELYLLVMLGAISAALSARQSRSQPESESQKAGNREVR